MTSPPKPRCYVNYLGCEKRKLDAQRVVNYLRANGYRLTPKSAEADVVIFLTCGYCNKYEEFSVAKFEKVYRDLKPGATCVVGGCLTAIHPERFEPFPRAIHMQARDLDALDGIIHAKVQMRQVPDPNTTIFDNLGSKFNKVSFQSPAENEYERAKQGYKIRISWGCLGNCAYCVTRLAEKDLASKPASLILEEFRRGLQAGAKSFFFTGGDTGAYGLDRQSSIADLLEQVLATPGTYKLHFQDFGVHWLIRFQSRLIHLFQVNAAKLGCFCFPIQSGSNRVLGLMRRPYRIEDVMATLQTLKQLVPSIKVGSHFIVGFPGETEADFQQSAEFVARAPLDFLAVFRYKDHLRADSRSFRGKVPLDVIMHRYETMVGAFCTRFLANSHQS